MITVLGSTAMKRPACRAKLERPIKRPAKSLLDSESEEADKAR